MATRMIARLFDDYDDAVEAVRRLEAAGVPHDDISLVANNAEGQILSVSRNESVEGAEVGAGLGAAAGGGVGVLAGLGLLAIPGVGPVVAAGWLAALAVGAVGGAAAGGLLGGLVGAGLSNEHAEVFVEGVRRGGSVVTARVTDDLATQAEAILDTHAVDPAARRTEYASSGWTAGESGNPIVSEQDMDRAERTGSH